MMCRKLPLIRLMLGKLPSKMLRKILRKCCVNIAYSHLFIVSLRIAKMLSLAVINIQASLIFLARL